MLHADEIQTDEGLVRRLLQDQFPDWAHLPLSPVRSSGTDNAMYRLGDRMAVRMPRIPDSVGQVEKEQRWLPLLAPHLPLPVPTPVAQGEPGHGYPWPWSIYDWIEGEVVTSEGSEHDVAAAVALGQFVGALRQIPPGDGPATGAHSFSRGVPLARRDAATRQAIAELDDLINGEAAAAAWDAALAAPVWTAPPTWIHGDLQEGNLLTRNGRLAAVIDFGGVCLGDPACDLMPGWNLFASTARGAFRDAASVDDAMWARGRGWALSVALIALPYYLHSSPAIAAASRRTIAAVLTDL